LKGVSCDFQVCKKEGAKGMNRKKVILHHITSKEEGMKKLISGFLKEVMQEEAE